MTLSAFETVDETIVQSTEITVDGVHCNLYEYPY